MNVALRQLEGTIKSFVLCDEQGNYVTLRGILGPLLSSARLFDTPEEAKQFAEDYGFNFIEAPSG